MIMPPVFPYTEREAEKAGVPYSSEENRKRPFPRRLAQLRAEKRMSQQQLADLLDVSKSTISLYEVGDTVPDAKMIVKLCEIFQVSTDYFLCQTDFRKADMEHMSVEDAGLSEQAAQRIQDLQYAYLDGERLHAANPFSPGTVFNYICEDERFLEMLRTLSNSYQMFVGAARAKETEPDPPASNLELIGIKGMLAQMGETSVGMGDAAEFYLQRACDILKAIIHDLPDKDADGNGLRIDIHGNIFNPMFRGIRIYKQDYQEPGGCL